MFIQQPVRVVATPIMKQEAGVKLDSLLRMHFTARMRGMVAENIQVLRLEVIDAVLVGASTQIDFLVSAEVASLDDFDAFIRSLFARGTTDDFEVVTVGFTAL